jgi:hypothetical protein
MYILEATSGTEAERREYDAAVAALRAALPGAFSAADPVPQRNVVMRLHIDRVTGRAAEPGHAYPGAAPRTGTVRMS